MGPPPSAPPDPTPPELTMGGGTGLLEMIPRVPNTEAKGQGREEDCLPAGGRVV